MSFPLRSAFGALAAFCALQAGSLHAQTVHEFSGQQISAPWSPGQGPFGRSVSGSLTPGAIRDAVVLCGKTPFVLVDVDVRDSKIQLAFEAEDIDVLPAGAPGGADALASVGAGGLKLTWFDAPSNAFVTTGIASGAWLGARRVRAIDSNGDGASDLVGIGADGRSLLVLVSQGSALAFATATGGSASASVRDLCGVQWDSDAPLELALLTDLGVEVREASGWLKDSWLATLPGGAIARLRQNGMSKDRIAWITAYAPPGLQYLMTLAPGGSVQDLVDLGALDAFSALGGDYDLDGDDDLLVSHHYSNELIWFENERSPSAPLVHSFQALVASLTLFRVGPPGVPAPQNQATPVRADLDGDGDLDVLYASQTSGSLELLRGETITEDAQKPQFVGGSWDPATSTLHGQVQAPAAGVGDATHLQVLVWRSPGFDQPFATEYVFQQKLSLAQGFPGGIDLVLPESTAVFAGIYSIEMRLLIQNAAGKVVASRPAGVNYLTGNDSNAFAMSSSPGCLGSLVIGTSGSAASELSKITLIKLPRTCSFGGGFVPYL